MPDPPPTLISDLVAPSDTNDAHSLTSPRAARISLRHVGLSSSTIDDRPHQISNYDAETDLAYPTSPASDTAFCSPSATFGGASNPHDADTTAGASRSSVNNSTNAEVVSNLNFSSFTSQPWPSTSAPQLKVAPRPIYEPTDEVVHAAFQDFEHFDDPSSFRQAPWASDSEKIAALAQSRADAINPAATVRDAHDFPKSALKRPLEPDGVGNPRQQLDHQDNSSQNNSRKLRRVSFEQMSGTGPVSADDADSSSSEGPSVPPPTIRQDFASSSKRARAAKVGSTATPRPPAQPASASWSSGPQGKGSKTPASHPSLILPREKVFPIQIGSELFRLSGASISSDAPSYFTQFFEEQIKQLGDSGALRTLYIDRDPETFRDIARHLQGYYVKPRDGSHFVKLFADAQFYGLQRLIDQLFEAEIYIQIGERHFQIPKDIFSDPGNSPNFFSLGFAVFFSTPGEVFPGLDRRGLLRPPSITPPYVPGRSAETFAQVLHLLRGYPLKIRDEEHRAELLRDCRYFHLRGLEQKIIAHDISYNLQRQQSEICLRIEDIKPSGISYKADDASSERSATGGWVRYARPFVDDESYDLIVEIGGESTVLDLNEMRADFHGLAKARVSSLFQVIANKMNLPTNAPLGAMMLSGAGSSSHPSPGHTPLSEDRVKVRFDAATDISLDGSRHEVDWHSALGQRMCNGPQQSEDGGGESDVMDEGLSAADIAPHRSRVKNGRPPGTNISSDRPNPAISRSSAPTAPPRIDKTNSSAPRKRRRPTTSSSDGRGQGEWIIRNAQWRLRVQTNQNDVVRGGYEIAFIAVKVDAFSQERARNARRKFLHGT